MVKHIVVWKLYDSAAGMTKKDNALAMKQWLEDLKSKIPEIKKLEVGINCNPQMLMILFYILSSKIKLRSKSIKIIPNMFDLKRKLKIYVQRKKWSTMKSKI